MKQHILHTLGWMLILIACLRAQSTQFNPSIRQIQMTFHGDSLIQLPDHFIIASTLYLNADSLEIDSTSYHLDNLNGKLRFLNPPDSGAVISIRYRILPVKLALSYRHFTLSDSADIQLPDSMAAEPVYESRSGPESEFEDAGSNLQRSGSIFRGITIGTNQGMRLQSGLRLQVSGQIVPGVDVSASLTDQNTPIQPEGNTQTLQEIDKVFVNISAKSLKATLGDFVFDTGPSGFGTYSRKLQGAMGSAEGRSGSITLIGAASKGQFTTNHIQGQESNQGPYQLTGEQGQQDIIVLAGTERVWIDGEPMIRGEDNDYIIEYSTGQITFTRNRLITGDSRITVDFEYSDLKFQKSIYGATGELRFWDDRIKFRTSFLRESDDKDNPLEIPLTDAYKQVLEKAGDSQDSASTSGATYVGEGKGSYKLVENGGLPYYQYVGNEQGDFTVRFTYVGEGQGEYSFQGYGFFQYEGKGRGSYIPSIRLPMATRHQILTMQSDLELVPGVKVSGEVGVSDLDLNLYSHRDDNDNTDHALQGGVRIAKKTIHIGKANLGMIDFSGNLRHVGDRFRPVGRMTDVEYGRRWGTAEGIFWGENLWEVKGSYSPVKTLTIGGETGDFHRGDFRSQRQMAMVSYQPVKLPKLQYQSEWIHTENLSSGKGRWLRQKGQIQQVLGMWTPSLRYEEEHRKDEDPDSVWTGFRFQEWGGGMAFQRGMVSGFVEETVRKYERYRIGHLQKESQGRIDKVQLALKPGEQFGTTLMFTHRDRNYEDPASQDQRSDLADAKIDFHNRKRWIDGQINYQFSSTRVSELVRDTIQVQTGLGNYRFDKELQELVPDQDGDLLLRMIQTGRFTPVNDLKAGVDLQWDGSRIWQKPEGLKSCIASLRTRTLYRVERRDSERDFAKVNRASLSPDWGNDSTLVTAMITLNQDVEIVPQGRDFSFRLRFKKNDSENNQLIRENQIRHVTERGIRLKGQPFRTVGTQVEYIFKQDDKIFRTQTYSDRKILSHNWNVEGSFRPKQQIELAMKTEIKFARDKVPDPMTNASSYFIVPRVSYAFRGRGNLRVELELGKVTSSPRNRALPYEMLSGDQPGRTLRWNILMTYRLSGHVMATLNYRARREPWRDSLYQTGQVEVRAFF